MGKLYARWGICDNTNFAGLKPQDYPILSDLYDLIEQEYREFDETQHQLYTKELQQEILRLKREKNICILAHAYQSQPVLEVADYTGDSYGFSVQAAKTNADGVIMCGVRFMAETCKILSPEKTVWLANPMAGCPMAELLDLATMLVLKKQYPGYAVVAYINTTSELKTACDVCVTSSSALKICSALENDKILFIPDPNLGGYVAKQLPEKQFAFYHGGCPRHIV